MTVACAQNGTLVDPGALNGFVPVDGNARWVLQGEVTTATAPRIFEDSAALPLPSTGVVDCSGVRIVDSTAVALLLSLKRRAKAEQKPVAFANIPAPLTALASVYGVADLLGA